MKHRGVIWLKLVIVEESVRDFHRAMTDAVEALEEAAQGYGWAVAGISDVDDNVPQDVLLLGSMPVD